MKAPAVSSLVQLFDASVDDVLLRRIARMVIDNYKRAFGFCEETFARPEAHDTLPHLRRAWIEQDLRHIAGSRDDVSATAEFNTTRNYSHTKIAAGRVVLTESAVATPDTMVRDAGFRFGYAAEYQLAMYFMNQVPPPEDGYVYAILIHYPDTLNPARPAFLHVVFPSSHCTSYVERIDLLRRYPELRTELYGDEAETIAAPAARLRRDARPGASEQEG